jgi:hypothetical protein
MMVEESFPAASLLRRVGAAAMMVAVPLQAARAEELPSYCAALREVTALVQAKERFKSIIGKPREGSFLETTLPLPGWADCSFYGARTYTCDSHPIDTTAEAGRAFERTFGEVKGCLREGWAEDASRQGTNENRPFTCHQVGRHFLASGPAAKAPLAGTPLPIGARMVECLRQQRSVRGSET